MCCDDACQENNNPSSATPPKLILSFFLPQFQKLPKVLPAPGPWVCSGLVGSPGFQVGGVAAEDESNPLHEGGQGVGALWGCSGTVVKIVGQFGCDKISRESVPGALHHSIWHNDIQWTACAVFCSRLCVHDDSQCTAHVFYSAPLMCVTVHRPCIHKHQTHCLGVPTYTAPAPTCALPDCKKGRSRGPSLRTTSTKPRNCASVNMTYRISSSLFSSLKGGVGSLIGRIDDATYTKTAGAVTHQNNSR